MAKISKHQGPSDASAVEYGVEQEFIPIRREEITGVLSPATEEEDEVIDFTTDEEENDEEDGGAPSVGSSSEPSSESEETSNGSNPASDLPPAPTTENLSSQHEGEDSTAPSTAGDTRKTQPRQSAKKAVKKSARSRAVDDEDEWE